MKRTILLVFCAIVCCVSLNAQTDLESNLKKHVSTLASPDMMGRGIGTIYEDKALDYIKSELEAIGLTTTLIEEDSDVFYKDEIDAEIEEVVVEEVVADDDSQPRKVKILYTVIKSTSTEKQEGEMLLMSEHTGDGSETIQGHVLIKHGACLATSNAAMIELAKKLKSRASELKRDVVIVFTSDYTSVQKYMNENRGMNIITSFGINRLNYYGEKEADEEDEYNDLLYSMKDGVNDFSAILAPVFLSDNTITTELLKSYNAYSYVRSGGPRIEAYADSASLLDYSKTALAVNNIEKVVLAINTANLKKEKKSKNQEDDDIDPMFSFGGKQYKHKSYFGLNFMYGDNTHDYKEGYMTGKESYALSAGIFYKWQFSKDYALKLDANYERAYAKRDDGKFRSDVISIPLTFMVSTSGISWMGFEVGIGAYYDYMLAGQLKHTVSGEFQYEDVDFNKFNRHEIGLNCEVSWRIGHFIVGYQYKHAYTDKMIDYPKGTIRENTSYLKLGWRF